MKIIRKIKFQVAIKIILVILGLVVLFHVLILAGIIPYQYVWGGRLKTVEQMRVFEAISIGLNLLMILIVAMKGKLIKPFLPGIVITIALWIFAALFALNTIGNLLALNSLETIIFTPITLLLTILFFRVAIE